MGKKRLFRNIERSVRNAVKSGESGIRHAVQKIDVRFELEPHRDAARRALESAEKELAEMNTILATARGIETDIKTRLEGASLTASAEERKVVDEKILVIQDGVQKLAETQEKVSAEKAIVSAERGKVSSIPNEVEDSGAAKEQAKNACTQALCSGTKITDMLVQARKELLDIQAAQQEIITRIQTRDLKETKEAQDTEPTETQQTQEQVTAANVKEEPPMPAEDKHAEESLSMVGHPIPVALPANQNYGEADAAVSAVLAAEQHEVDRAAPPPCGVLSQGAPNAPEDLPPSYEANPAVVLHLEQAEDPQAVIQRLQAQLAEMQQQFELLRAQQDSSQIVTPAAPVVTPLLDAQAQAAADMSGQRQEANDPHGNDNSVIVVSTPAALPQNRPASGQ